MPVVSSLLPFFAKPLLYTKLGMVSLFGRSCLPHRSSLSRFLADVDRPCLEAFRTLFQLHSFIEGWMEESIGGLWDRQGRHYIVFDVDATRQAARQRALPCDPTLPAAKRGHNIFYPHFPR